jgi:1-pyrroline-5-carboxylate dehydrogenase
MNNAIYNFREPVNEKVLSYSAGSPERKMLEAELAEQESKIIDIPLIIGGKEIRTGVTGKIIKPSEHSHVLAAYHMATEKEVSMAIDAALEAKCEWMTLAWMERASIMIKAAELISQKYRYKLNAATMLGQGKNTYQAEIDSACEVIDYLRFNSHFASLIYMEQPVSDSHSINRIEYRPLEGFVYTISPFNFTAIAANLNTSVALMGNTTVWKPASTAVLSGYYLMKILKEAGLPDGVINFIPGKGSLISDIVLKQYQGQKCSAASRAYIPESMWKETERNLLEIISGIKIGDVTDFSATINPVIDEPSYDKIMKYIGIAKSSENARVIAGGNGNKSKGYFIEPTVIVTTDPHFITMEEEIFGPVITIYVYPDEDFEMTLKLCDTTSPYGLTGSVFSNDKYAMIKACRILRYAAGNFYINDKPTGAMVGQQPFGGSRASGTNDKAGSYLNLVRWVSPRTIKETLIPSTDFKYPFME